MSSRNYRNLILTITILINVGIGITTFILFKDFNITLFRYIYLIATGLTLLVIAIICIYLIANRKNTPLLKIKILDAIEFNLISIGAYYNEISNNVYALPKIKIDLKHNTIKIVIDDIKIRKLIESYKDFLGSALPSNLIIDDYFISNDAKQFIINYHNVKEDKQVIYNSLKEYKSIIDNLKLTEMLIDGKHIINLIDYPHFLISGSSGSGKTYLTQLLVIQSIIKKYDITILDVKKTYLAFKPYVYKYETKPNDILRCLKDIANEMEQRQNNLEEILKINPQALAIEYGYKQKIIIIEEYIGLKTLLDKEQVKELDNVVKKISVLARSVNISLFIVAQSSSIDILDSAIKNNLNKIFLGRLASNIAISTFGTGVEIPLFNEIKKGYGYIQLDRVEQVKIARLIYKPSELEMLVNEP